MSRLQGKAALITGAGSGIGRQAALLFAAEGARVAVLDRDLASAQEVVASIRDAKGEAIAVHADVTEAESVENAVRRAVEAFGALHVIFNNAGGSSSRDGKVTEAPFDEFWRAIKLDLWGTWLVCHYGIPELIKSGGGSVINASSVVALMGWPGKDAYTAAKGGVTALTRSMAVEYARDNVRVNAVAPCTTRTPRVMAQLENSSTTQKMVEQHLMGLADATDIAQAALYLASSESARTTGHILAVDSGLTIS